MGGWRGVVACLSGDNGEENSSFGSQGSQDVTGMAFPASGQGQMECPWCCLPLLLHLVWFLPVQSKPQSLGCFLPPPAICLFIFHCILSLLSLSLPPVPGPVFFCLLLFHLSCLLLPLSFVCFSPLKNKNTVSVLLQVAGGWRQGGCTARA